MMKRVLLVCGALSLLGAASVFAFPAIDLTAGQQDVTSAVDGTIWGSEITAPTGSGIYEAFVREQANDSEEGFNTDANPVPLDDLNGVFTKSVQFNTLATVTFNGVEYYSFQLDANEPNGPEDATKSLLSLDTIEIYKAGTGDIGSYGDLTSTGTLLYDMDDFDLDGVADAGEDQTVYIETRLKQGSGTDDVTLLIPKSFFGSAAGTDYMYFYSAFGGTFSADPGLTSADGFEEWRALQGGGGEGGSGTVPEPGTMMLLGSGLAGLIGFRARKK